MVKEIDLSIPLYINLRRLFYIIPPNESMFEHVDEVPNYVGEVRAFYIINYTVLSLVTTHFHTLYKLNNCKVNFLFNK